VLPSTTTRSVEHDRIMVRLIVVKNTGITLFI